MRRELVVATTLLLIAVVTLTPRDGGKVVEPIPLAELSDAVGAPDLRLLVKSAANVLLFVPLGAALAWRGASVRRALFWGVSVSGSIEIVQWLVVPGRTSSADDVLLNMLGIALGYLALSTLLPQMLSRGAAQRASRLVRSEP